MYRTPYKPIVEKPALSYDYAAKVEADRPGVAFSAFMLGLVILMVIGIGPFVGWFGWMGIPIGLGCVAFVAVPVAIRRSRVSLAQVMEEKLLRKASRRKRM